MTDDTAQNATSPADAQDANATDPSPASEQDSQPTGFDALPRETQDEIRKLRRENAKFRTQVKEIEEAKLTEAEKRDLALKSAEERATAAELRLRAATGKVAVQEAASRSGAIEPAAIYALVDDALEYDDDGEPQNVTEVVAAAKRRYPALFPAAAGSGDGGKGGSSPTTDDMNAAMRKALGYQQ